MASLCPRFCVNIFLDSRISYHIRGRSQKIRHHNELVRILVPTERQARCRICRSNEGEVTKFMQHGFSSYARLHDAESADSVTDRCCDICGQVSKVGSHMKVKNH